MRMSELLTHFTLLAMSSYSYRDRYSNTEGKVAQLAPMYN